jgi:hypothetical protein
MDSYSRKGLYVAGLVVGILTVALVASAAVSTVPASGTIQVQANSGATIIHVNVNEFPAGNPFVDSDGDSTTDSIITKTGARVGGNNSQVSIRFFPGDLDDTYAVFDTVDAESGAAYINATNRQRLVVSSSTLQKFEYRQVDYASGQRDLTYTTQAGDGITKLQLSRQPNTDALKAVATANGEVLGYDEVTGGTTTLRLDERSDEDVDLVAFNATTPTISNPSPTQPVNDDPVTLQADIGDDDLPADNVSVSIALDGTQVSQQWVNSSDSTVSHTLNSVTAGPHTWSVTATDKYGESVSKSYSFGVPDTLYIRNESNASQLVKSPTEVEVQFFADNGSVYRRSTTTGTVDMRGLPATEDFYVQANADGYHERTVYLQSLIQQQTVYLLNKSVPTATIVFELDDATGRFPPSDSTLFVQKAINKSGTVEYRTVVSDQFGAANEIVTDLEDNQRYRLKVVSPTGETRVLGAYKTAGDARAVLPIGQVSVGNPDETGVIMSAEMVEQSGNAAVRIVYRDTSDQTDDLQLEIHETGDQTAILRANTTENGPFGVYTETYPLSAPYGQNSSLTVRWHANRTGGTDKGGTINVGKISGFGFGNIDPTVLSLLGWVGLVAVAGFTAPVSGALGAFASVIFATFLSLAGVLSIPGALLGLAGAVAVLFIFGGEKQ